MLNTRPPVVVILGHVDHGKTSLLDKIRQTNVTAREAGGITQHIGAYQADGITFIDTPGHAAFSQMRSRGGSVADIAVLVIAANEGVKPQTKEAIDIIKSTNLPLIVAATKIDLPDSSIEKIKGQLAEHEVVPEDYGGDVPIVPLSAKTGEGIDKLLEMIKLINELHPTQADPDAPLEGIVIESNLDKFKGPLASILVRNGTLKVGDTVYAGEITAKVKSMTSDTGKVVLKALPAQPVSVLGFSTVPPVGSLVSTSKVISTPSQPKLAAATSDLSLKIILKADVEGSLEAIQSSFPSENLLIISASTGPVTESDVLDAVSHKARIYSFNSPVPSSVKKLAEIEKISIKSYSIIYELLEDIEERISLILNPELAENMLGIARIQTIFDIDKQKIAGSRITEGVLSKGDEVHVKRGEAKLGNSRIKSLKKGKEDVSSVKSGDECGILLSASIDFAPGDDIIAFSRK